MKKCAIVLAFLLVAALVGAESARTERFALIAGSNVGGKATTNLKYAVNDARRMHEVLLRLGGIKADNAMLLANPGKESIVNGISFIASKIEKNRNAGNRSQFVFYYSGHSDERGLLLFGDYLDYADLHASIEALGAEVQLVILDSCASGAFTRNKGGQFGLPFLLDESSVVEGHAFLTSSTEDELSQESDRIASSFFTNSLVSALSGAGDSDGDGTITLNEAYDYAYERTLAETERTRTGAQHPAFDIQLNGKGTLVLTDLRRGESVVRFPKGLKGRLSIRDLSDTLVIEITKVADRDLAVALAHGFYRVLLDEGSSVREASLTVDESREYDLGSESFKKVQSVKTASRGPAGFPFAFFPIGLQYTPEGLNTSLYLNLLGGKALAVDGFMASVIYNQTVNNSSGFQGSIIANISGGGFSGVQATYACNLTSGDLYGLQFGFLLNHVGGNLFGVQLAALNHVSGNAKLGQIGILNYVEGEGRFFQAGGLNQVNGSIRGLQAGFVNKVDGELLGVQAGWLNLAKAATGVQVGLVNYSENQTGVQVGIINVSKHLDGLPVGLIDIQFNGENHIDLIAEMAPTGFDTLFQNVFTSAYCRFGSKYFYKYLNVGYLTASGAPTVEFPLACAGLGLGFRLPVYADIVALHLDGGVSYHFYGPTLTINANDEGPRHLVPQFRLFASAKLFGNVGFVAGFEQRAYIYGLHDNSAAGTDLLVSMGEGLCGIDSKFFIGIQF